MKLLQNITRVARQVLFSFLLWGVVLGWGALSSCSDFLEPKSTSEFVPKDAQALNEVLLGAAYPRYDITRLNSFLGILDDDVAAAPYQDPVETVDANRYFYPYTWQGDLYTQMDDAGFSATNTNMYAQYYSLIKGCNAVIDYIDDVNDTEEKINYVKAQAYALRGFYNLMLVNIYGVPYNSNPQGLGVPIKRNSGIEGNSIVRNTVADCYTFIEENLLEAERLYLTLPENQQWTTNYRTSLPMVWLLLSRMYLYTENWEKASLYAAKLMEDKRFRLLDLNNVPLRDGTVRTFMDYNSFENSTETIWPYGSVSDMTLCVSDNTGRPDGGFLHPYFRASQELLDTYDADDLRLDRYITLSYYRIGTGFMPQAFGKIRVGTGSASKEVQYNPSSSATSVTFGRCLRLSEAYLNYMEAEAMMAVSGQGENHRTNALTALNKLRQYRYAPNFYQEVSLTDNNELLQFVKDERRRELCFEGHRWFDLRRWGMPEIKHTWYMSENTVMVYKLKQGDPSYVVPIPDQAITLNPSLVQSPLPEIPRRPE